jgi:hypothetical protein
MITLLPIGGPLETLHVSVGAAWAMTRQGVLIGFMDDQGALYGVVVGEGGQVLRLATNEFTIDWRYDVETDQWVDIYAKRSAETGAEI